MQNTGDEQIFGNTVLVRGKALKTTSHFSILQYFPNNLLKTMSKHGVMKAMLFMTRLEEVELPVRWLTCQTVKVLCQKLVPDIANCLSKDCQNTCREDCLRKVAHNDQVLPKGIEFEKQLTSSKIF